MPVSDATMLEPQTAPKEGNYFFADLQTASAFKIQISHSLPRAVTRFA